MISLKKKSVQKSKNPYFWKNPYKNPDLYGQIRTSGNTAEEALYTPTPEQELQQDQDKILDRPKVIGLQNWVGVGTDVLSKKTSECGVPKAHSREGSGRISNGEDTWIKRWPAAKTVPLYAS